MKQHLKLAKFVIVENHKLKKRIKNLEKMLIELSNFKEFLTPKEVELEYRICRKTLSRYRNEGLKVVQAKRNGKILVKRTELEKFLNSNKYDR